jgi:cohesin complex subunit SCC1
MFLTEAILRPKEPLARVWLAAHMERKLTKAMLVDTDLTNPISKKY